METTKTKTMENRITMYEVLSTDFNDIHKSTYLTKDEYESIKNGEKSILDFTDKLESDIKELELNQFQYEEMNCTIEELNNMNIFKYSENCDCDCIIYNQNNMSGYIPMLKKNTPHKMWLVEGFDYSIQSNQLHSV